MKIRATTEGDESVGIFGYDITINWNLSSNMDSETRESTRTAITNMLKELDQTGICVWFEDECPDCFKIKDKNNRCNNKNCVSYDMTKYDD